MAFFMNSWWVSEMQVIFHAETEAVKSSKFVDCGQRDSVHSISLIT